MANLVRCVLGNLEHSLPMPDRDYQLFPQSKDGRIVDIERPFYRTALADGSIKRHPDPNDAGLSIKESDAGESGKSKPPKGAKS